MLLALQDNKYVFLGTLQLLVSLERLNLVGLGLLMEGDLVIIGSLPRLQQLQASLCRIDGSAYACFAELYVPPRDSY